MYKNNTAGIKEAIIKAIASAPNRQLKLREIEKYLKDNYNYEFIKKGAISHCLYFNHNVFVQVPGSLDKDGKVWSWGIKEESEACKRCTIHCIDSSQEDNVISHSDRAFSGDENDNVTISDDSDESNETSEVSHDGNAATSHGSSAGRFRSSSCLLAEKRTPGPRETSNVQGTSSGAVSPQSSKLKKVLSHSKQPYDRKESCSYPDARQSSRDSNKKTSSNKGKSIRQLNQNANKQTDKPSTSHGTMIDDDNPREQAARLKSKDIEETVNQGNSSSTTAHDRIAATSQNATNTLTTTEQSTANTSCMIEVGKGMKRARKRRGKKLNVSTEKNKQGRWIVENIKLSPNSRYDIKRKLNVSRSEKLNESIHETVRDVSQTCAGSFRSSSCLPAEKRTPEPRETSKGTSSGAVSPQSSTPNKSQLSLRRKVVTNDNKSHVNQLSPSYRVSVDKHGEDIGNRKSVNSPVSMDGKRFDRLKVVRCNKFEIIREDQPRTNRDTVSAGTRLENITEVEDNDENASGIENQGRRSPDNANSNQAVVKECPAVSSICQALATSTPALKMPRKNLKMPLVHRKSNTHTHTHSHTHTHTHTHQKHH